MAPLEKSPEAYKTISEAAEELGVEQHVLRFWETKFPQVKPLKRRGGRRFYRPEDMAALHRIRDLLKAQGFTIKGAKKALSDKSAEKSEEAAVKPPRTAKPSSVSTPQLDLLAAAAPASGLTDVQRHKLADILAQLQSARNRLQSVA